jgi:hypothetical protein
MSKQDAAKTTTEKKPRKPAAKKKAALTPVAEFPSATTHVAPPSREEIARLAEKYWRERGREDGQAEQDWLRAEQELRGRAS